MYSGSDLTPEQSEEPIEINSLVIDLDARLKDAAQVLQRDSGGKPVELRVETRGLMSLCASPSRLCRGENGNLPCRK